MSSEDPIRAARAGHRVANGMTYAFANHLARLVPAPSATGPRDRPRRAFVLIDAGQLADAESRPRWDRLAPAMPVVHLFEHTFASPAIALSPLLFELPADADSDADALTPRLLALDGACRHLPMMSVTHSPQPLDGLARHLRALMPIEADGTSYLLRFADSQMLTACNAALTPHQRAAFFAGVDAWFTVDHRGQLKDEADPSRQEQATPGATLPLKLDQMQTNALMEAAALPMLASRLRHFEHSFGLQFSHARQIEFVACGVEDARAVGISDETAVVEWLLQRWQAQREGIA